MRSFLKLFVLLTALAALPAAAQTVEPSSTTSTVVSSSDPVETFLSGGVVKLYGVVFTPSISVTPLVLPIGNLVKGQWTPSTGPNVGLGVDITGANGYGGSPHFVLRDTGAGPKPLLSAFAVIPPLVKYGVRVGAGWQTGGGAAKDWQGNVMLMVTGATSLQQILQLVGAAK